jgi:hypothetical protein
MSSLAPSLTITTLKPPLVAGGGKQSSKDHLHYSASM